MRFPERRIWATLAGVGWLVLAVWCAPAGAEVALPRAISAGPDGNLWFTDANKIGQITPTGTITEFAGTPALGGPQGITAGPDGNLWFADTGVNKIGQITPSGTITEFSGPPALSEPKGITTGADGNLWFTDYGDGKIGRITPTGTIQLFPGPPALSGPLGITAGPDGNVWFADTFANKIGRITPAGTIQEFAGPPTLNHPFEITTGPDGNLWFTDSDNNKIGRITPAGAITEFPSGISTLHEPTGITTGPDGNLWFSDAQNNEIGQITPAGAITEFPIATPMSLPAGIVAGPDGNVWYATQPHGIGTIATAVPAPTTGNLLRNPGGELGKPAATNVGTVPVLGWAATGNFTTLASGAPGGFPSATTGGAFFAAGPANAVSRAIQDVDVSSHAAEIDAARATAVLGGQLGGLGAQNDTPSLTARFLDANLNPLGSLALSVSAADRGALTAFLPRQTAGLVPAGTRTIQVIAAGQNAGPASSYDDAYFDDLDLEVNIAPLPGSGSPGPSSPATVAIVSKETLSPSSFPAAPSGASATAAKHAAKRHYGTKVTFVLNLAATVRFTVTQAHKGRKTRSGHCVKPTKSNRKAHACTRTVTLPGHFTRAGVAGKNTFRFTGRLNGHKLKHGTHKLVATPTTTGAHAASATFHITA